MKKSQDIFPSGRSVKRCKRDAKERAKKLGISHSEALDQIAKENGGSDSWAKSLKSIQPQRQRKSIRQAQTQLLGHALNLLKERDLIDLESTEPLESGYLECDLIQKPTLINWSYIGYGEIRISVWWNFNKSMHPQHLAGGFRNEAISPQANTVERYRTSIPLAKKHRFIDFVGVTCSTWLERKDGKYLQTDDGIFDSYIRSKDKDDLCQIPDCRPSGFQLSGKFRL